MLKLEEHLPFEFIAVFAQGIIWSHIIACKKNSGEDVRCKTARQPILFESAGNTNCGNRTLRMWCFLTLLMRTFSECAV